MNLKPVQSYNAPHYPTKSEFQNERHLLGERILASWKGKALITGALIAFSAFSAPGPLAAEAQMPSSHAERRPFSSFFESAMQIPEETMSILFAAAKKSAVVAPLFIHGGGTGSSGGIAAFPLTSLKEDEARKIIESELKKAGFVFDRHQVQVKGVTIEGTSGEPEQTKTQCPLIADGVDSKHNLAYEYVSGEGYKKIAFHNRGTLTSVNYRNLAEEVRKGFSKAGTMNAIVFYDPMPSDCKKEEAEKLLREQIVDFVKWARDNRIVNKAMHLTLHLTTGCTMKCDYCYAPPTSRRDMAPETAQKAIEWLSTQHLQRTGILFFGGEPLLRKDLIHLTIDRCRDIERQGGPAFHFRVTTNGLLLDREFVEYAKQEDIQIALSIDGVREAHDRHRLSPDGKSLFKLVEERAEMLIASLPYATAMMTVAADTVCHYADSVEFLLAKGFRYLVISLDYGSAWDESSLDELEKQYIKLAQLYKRLTLEEKKFYLSPFEQKLASFISEEETFCRNCHLGFRQISVAPDGSFYPCIQFVSDGSSNRAFVIGDVDGGIDEARREKLYGLSRQRPTDCSQCCIEHRCNHRCSCINFYTTGKVDKVSPVVCISEQLLVPIVDELGRELYDLKSPMFLQKHYNPAYPVLSMLEEL